MSWIGLGWGFWRAEDEMRVVAKARGGLWAALEQGGRSGSRGCRGGVRLFWAGIQAGT